MGRTITQQEYAMQFEGYTSVEYRVGKRKALLIGCSSKYEGELFYFIEKGEKITGPFYFCASRDYAKDLLRSPMGKRDKARLCIAESEVME